MVEKQIRIDKFIKCEDNEVDEDLKDIYKGSRRTEIPDYGEESNGLFEEFLNIGRQFWSQVFC